MYNMFGVAAAAVARTPVIPKKKKPITVDAKGNNAKQKYM